MKTQNCTDPLLSAILAKDDDAEIFQSESGEIIIAGDIEKLQDTGLISAPTESSLPNVEDLLDSELLEREMNAPAVDVVVQVVTNMFLIVAIFNMVCMLLGSVPYWLLKYDESGVIVKWVFGITSVLLVGSYILMLVLRENKKYSLYALVLWCFLFVIWIGTFAAMLKNITPFQTMGVFWAQSIGVFVYGRVSRRSISHWIALMIMLVATLIVWCINLYGFITLQDWATAGVILGIGFCSSVYNMYQITWAADRYCATDTILSVINFFGDPVLWMLRSFKIINAGP